MAKHKLALVGVLEVRWDRGGKEPANNYKFFYGNENDNDELDTNVFIHSVRFVSDRMSYAILKGIWCDIIALNVHALTENKTLYQGQLLYGTRICILSILKAPYNNFVRRFQC